MSVYSFSDLTKTLMENRPIIHKNEAIQSQALSSYLPRDPASSICNRGVQHGIQQHV